MPTPTRIELKAGHHVIRIECPHIENGACGECLAVQVMPYVAAREALDRLLPALNEVSGTLAKLTTWAQARSRETWTLGPREPALDDALPSVHPASAPPAATVPPGAEARAKSAAVAAVPAAHGEPEGGER